MPHPRGNHTFTERQVTRYWRLIRANLRDARLLLRESAPQLLGFLLVWGLGGTFLWAFYRERPDQPLPSLRFGEALYSAFLMIVFENNLAFPVEWWIGLVFFALPLIGLILLAQGALNFGLLLIDKRNRAEAWQMALASTYHNHVIVCGLGKVGYRVVQELRAIKHDAVVIESRSDSQFVELTRAQEVPVVIGDARQVEVLEAAGLQQATSVTIVTSDDLTNLDIALTARAARPGVHIVMRVFSDTLATKLESAFNIRTAFSTSLLAAPTFAAASVGRSINHALHVRGHLLTTSELQVMRGSSLDGRMVGQLEREYDIIIVLVDTEGKQDMRPPSEYRISAGDVLVVLGDLDTLIQLRDLGQQPNPDPMGARRQENRRGGMFQLNWPGLPQVGMLRPRGAAAVQQAYEERRGTTSQLRTNPLPELRVCPHCNAELNLNARFCHACGKPAAEPEQPAPANQE